MKRMRRSGRTTRIGIQRDLESNLSRAGVSNADLGNVTQRVFAALSDANIENTRREAERLGITSENTAR